MSEAHHRGAHPDDARLFGAATLPRLARAAEEVAWLLGRGYAMPTAVAAVGGHHQLESRQRVALARVCCAPDERAGRRARALAPADIAGRALRVDGFNLVVTLEVALGGGVVLLGADGAARDLAGMRGSYHPVAETEAALGFIGAYLTGLAPSRVDWLLDAPVSNSGRLRARILEHAAAWPFPGDVTLVPDPDPLLSVGESVVSSDAAILERCASWVNLTTWVMDAHMPGAWRVCLLP